jgi:hypothetical protein
MVEERNYAGLCEVRTPNDCPMTLRIMMPRKKLYPSASHDRKLCISAGICSQTQLQFLGPLQVFQNSPLTLGQLFVRHRCFPLTATWPLRTASPALTFTGRTWFLDGLHQTEWDTHPDVESG